MSQDMMVIGAGNPDEYFVGAGAGIETSGRFLRRRSQWKTLTTLWTTMKNCITQNKMPQDWMDDPIEDLAPENDINVAPMVGYVQRHRTVNEADAQDIQAKWLVMCMVAMPTETS